MPHLSPTQPRHAKTRHLPWRGHSDFLCLSWREWPRLPSTARIERAQFHRARSASKEGTKLLPTRPSQTARCASTGIVLTTSPHFSAFLLALCGEMGNEPIADRSGHLVKILPPSELVIGSWQEI